MTWLGCTPVVSRCNPAASALLHNQVEYHDTFYTLYQYPNRYTL